MHLFSLRAATALVAITMSEYKTWNITPNLLGRNSTPGAAAPSSTASLPRRHPSRRRKPARPQGRRRGGSTTLLLSFPPPLMLSLVATMAAPWMAAAVAAGRPCPDPSRVWSDPHPRPPDLPPRGLGVLRFLQRRQLLAAATAGPGFGGACVGRALGSATMVSAAGAKCFPPWAATARPASRRRRRGLVAPGLARSGGGGGVRGWPGPA
jgi:hypothetical protein